MVNFNPTTPRFGMALSKSATQRLQDIQTTRAAQTAQQEQEQEFHNYVRNQIKRLNHYRDSANLKNVTPASIDWLSHTLRIVNVVALDAKAAGISIDQNLFNTLSAAISDTFENLSPEAALKALNELQDEKEYPNLLDARLEKALLQKAAEGLPEVKSNPFAEKYDVR